jgi:hypothetical protein
MINFRMRQNGLKPKKIVFLRLLDTLHIKEIWDPKWRVINPLNIKIISSKSCFWAILVRQPIDDELSADPLKIVEKTRMVNDIGNDSQQKSPETDQQGK